MFGWKTKQPNRRATEMTGAYDGGLAMMTQGLIAGTRVASNLGWRAVEALAVGDSVLTFDNGMQRITELRRLALFPDAPDTAAACWPVVVPEGALDNRAELTLLPDQGVLVESDAASDMYGDPFAVVPAQALVGLRGIHRAAPQHKVELVIIAFAEEQVIYAEGGTLIHCPLVRPALDNLMDKTSAVYDVLGMRDAAYVAGCLSAEDRILATAGRMAGPAAYC
ncbi:Hint domain-containing protein [Sulfitobacter alexandrii]|nr:Hint domain-containing protein [Sulfitobacter alexandrii]